MSATGKSKSGVTDHFKEAIRVYLEEWATQSEDNLAKYETKGKSLDDCCTYILNQVKKSGVQGFADQEIFDMAVEYYEAKRVDIGGKITSGQVVINRTVELTKEEKEKAKADALAELKRETKSKARRKPSTTTKKTTSKKEAPKKAEKPKEPEKPKPPVHPTLF